MRHKRSKPPFIQRILIDRVWVKESSYLTAKDTIKRGPLLTKNKRTLSKKDAVLYGMDSHLLKSKRGFGTKFHSIYREAPKIYDDFSWAEDKEDLILKKIIFLKKKHRLHTLLDVACGTGKFLRKIYTATHFNKLYGLDSSEALLSYAKSKLPESTTLLLSSAENIPLLSNSIDFCLTTWGSFSPNETLREMERVTKNGGVIFRVGTANLDDLTSLFPEYDKNTVQLNKEFLKSSGFSTEIISIKITFDSLKKAQQVLSKITGCDPKKIKKRILNHQIYWSWKIVRK